MRSGSKMATVGLVAATIVCGTCLTLLARTAIMDRRALSSQPGAAAPDLALPVVNSPGKVLRLSDFRGTPTVLFFCSVRCPVSNDYDSRIQSLCSKFGLPGQVQFVAVHTGASATSTPEAITAVMSGRSTPMIHVTDASGAVAARYNVTLTPTFVLLDQGGVIRYRGALDDNRLREQARTAPLADAIEALLVGEPVPVPVTAAHGCVIR